MAVTPESLEPKPLKDVPGLIDPNVAIPASVKAASARADAAFKAAYPDATPDASPTNQDAGVTEGEPPAGAPAPTPEGSTEAPADLPPNQGEEGDWEHKYTSMRGRYDRAQNDIKAMAEQITNLQNVLATVSSLPATPQPVPRESRAESLLTEEDINDYGAEFLDVVGKKAREVTSSYVSGLQSEIQALKQQLGYVGGSIAQNAREQMFSVLDQHLPAWREVNHNPRFFQWLALPDMYSGAIRHNLLKAAWDRNDAARSLAFFQGFLAEEAAVDPAHGGYTQNTQPVLIHQPPPQSNGQAPAQGNGKVALESYAAPGRAKSAAELPAEKPFITRSDIARFYAESRANKYSGREAERAQREREIFAAQADGRIIDG